ncbi:MAG: hypothetical protein J5994_10790 [Ruminococcus sp.]|nr:hypothetical protein [Ruminococcus sp.]
MSNEEFAVCFEEFKKSKASENADEEIVSYHCDRSGIYMTFWGEPEDDKLERECRRTCPFFQTLRR